VVEKVVPHRVGIFEIEDLERARAMIEKGLATYRQCQITDVWDMPDMEIYTI
jgi:hypothetical protein